MIKLRFIIVFIAITACSDTKKWRFVLPDWEKGDYRYVETTVTSFSRVNEDTIYNLAADNLYKLSVIDKSSNNYIIELQNISKPNFSLNTQLDTLSEDLNKLVNLIQNFPKISIPYQVKVSEVGEIQEILNWDKVLNQFINRTVNIADSLGFQPEDHAYLKKYFSSSIGIEENLRNTLFKEISDNFDLYNTQIPTDSVIIEQIQVPKPNTGAISDANLEYRTLSINNGMYEIEMRINFSDDFFESPEESLESFFDEEKKSDVFKPKMENYTIFYWNSHTSWIDSSKFYMDLQTDTIEVKMRTSTRMYKKITVPNNV